MGLLIHLKLRGKKIYVVYLRAAVNALIESDVLGAEEAGKTEYETFVKSRIIERKLEFHAPIEKLKLETFKSTAKYVKLSGSKKKQLELKASHNIAFQLLALAEKHQLDLGKCFEYPFGPVSWPLGTADGFLAKTEKSTGMHYIEKKAPRASSESTVVIDGNAFFYSIGKAAKTFKDVASNILDMMPNIPKTHFSTDMYKEFSMKSMERSRRGNSDALIIKGGNMKVPQDFKGFLSNDKNKRQLICLLLKEWVNDCYATRIRNRNIYFVCEEECFKLEADGNHVKSTKIGNLGSCQEKNRKTYIQAIHRLFTMQLKSMQPLSLTQACLLDLSALFTAYEQKYCKALLSLHTFSHCYTTSAFVHIDKVKPIKTLEKFPHFQKNLRELGKNWELDERTMVDLEHFV